MTALSPPQFDGLPLEEEVLEGDGSLEKELAIDNIIGEKIEIIAPVNSPSLDFNDNEDIPTELSDSSDTHDEGRHLKMGAEWPFLSVLKAKRMSLYGDWNQSLGSWGKDGWITVLFCFFLRYICY